MEEKTSATPLAGDDSNQERFTELRETAQAVGTLAGDAENFRRVVEAFRARDVEGFQSGLTSAGLFERCPLICRWLCSKHCVFVCRRLCGPEAEQKEIDVEEWRQFALTTARIAEDESLVKRLVDAVDREDVEAWKALVAELKLERFCHQLCHWLCGLKCRWVCRLFCPPPPLITAVGFIPTAQIDNQGYGSGPDIYLTNTPAVNKPDGIGDHPFGGRTNIQGVFNVANADHYKVEYTTTPMIPASWTAIPTQINDYCWNGMNIQPYLRQPDLNGWYQIPPPPPPCPPPGPAETHGMGFLGPVYLTDWDTPNVANDLHYLRLTVKKGAAEFPSPIVPVRIDNGMPLPTPPPASPIIKLQVQDPNNNLKDLGCCDTIEKGDGNVLVISVQAWDPNFSRLDITLYGGCGVSVPVHTKTYNGNLADTGYPALTPIIWDPWKAGVSPCCYVLWVQILDRAIVNNQWAGRHSRSNWQSITIG